MSYFAAPVSRAMKLLQPLSLRVRKPAALASLHLDDALHWRDADEIRHPGRNPLASHSCPLNGPTSPAPTIGHSEVDPTILTKPIHHLHLLPVLAGDIAFLALLFLFCLLKGGIIALMKPTH